MAVSHVQILPAAGRAMPLQAVSAGAPYLGTEAWQIPAKFVPWIFATKTTLSALISLLIAFTFNLDQPKWAMITVFIVALPRTGSVIAKSCYRLVGTAVGASTGLLLVAMFAQERVLFLGSLAIWIGFCTFASQYVKSFASYGFVLSGYTVAIAGIPGALDPTNAFYIAQARTTEITLGIIVTATISYMFLPLTLTSQLYETISQARVSLRQYVVSALAGAVPPRGLTTNLQYAAKIGSLLAPATFEDSEVRTRGAAIQQMNTAFVRVVSLARLFARHNACLPTEDGPADAALKGAACDAVRAIQDWGDERLGLDGLRIRVAGARTALALPQQRSFAVFVPEDQVLPRLTAAALLDDLLESFVEYAVAYGSLATNTAREPHSSGLVMTNDWVSAAAKGIRAALGVACVSAFWIAADWPSGVTAAILASVVTARLATMEKAETVAIAGTLIFALVPIPGFVLLEVLLPDASDFAMFTMVVGPAIFLLAYLMGHETSPLKYLVGFLCGLYIPSAAGFQDSIHFDAIGFINTSVATVFAAAVGAVLFAVLAPETPQAAYRRFVRFSRRMLMRIAAMKTLLRPADFEAAMANALEEFGSGGSYQRDGCTALDGGVALLVIGRGLMWLRTSLPDAEPRSHIETELAAFARNPDARRLAQTRSVAREGAAIGFAGLQDGTLSNSEATELVRRIAAFTTIDAELEPAGALVLQQERLG
jgi:uncharacterized membrane protein YccC